MALKRALVVDDSKVARVTLQKQLQAHNLAVELAVSRVVDGAFARRVDERGIDRNRAGGADAGNRFQQLGCLVGEFEHVEKAL